MIYYFTPYDSRGLGFAYNSHCELVPRDTDWICLMDLDVMHFSSQRLGDVLEETIKLHHPRFAAFTTTTNRAFKSSQQQLKGIREERDLLKLKKRADHQMRARQGRVEELKTAINGHFMLFPKSLWKCYPFATRGGSSNHPGHRFLGIDTDWRNRLYKAGLRIGVIHQIMSVHYYRLDGSAPIAVTPSSLSDPA